MAAPSRGICLYGTDEPAGVPRLLTAGPVTVELEQGALRHIKYGGIEVLRGIAFLVRDGSWGTYSPDITALEVEETDDGFVVRYQALCSDKDQAFAYTATITGTGNGAVAFAVEGAAESVFTTNRCGFVVLHGLAGVAGEALTVTHTDGSKENTTFPLSIAPSQPVFDIRALSHTVCPGVTATCTMTGDAFEMEDQRNWTDASYKTYIRPLAKPRPYTLAAQEVIRQSVQLDLEGTAKSTGNTVASDAVVVDVGAAGDLIMPRIGLALEPSFAQTAVTATAVVKSVHPQLLLCQLNMAVPDHGALSAYAKLALSSGAAVMLELILPDDADPQSVIAEAAVAIDRAGLPLESVAVSPACYLGSFQPDDEWPDVPDLTVYYDAVHSAFPGTKVGGGMFSYFTELNRKRPPIDALDFVTHTTCPIVHDADDRSVMETLEALPYAIASTRRFAGGKPYRVGPSTIGMRHNPYGSAPAENPENRRVAMARSDPRHRGLFGAAWSVGYAAEMIRGGIDVLTPAAVAGAAGIVHSRTASGVPYYGEDGDAGAPVYPLYHVVRGLAALAGQAVRPVEISDSTRVQAFACETDTGTRIWLANLTPDATEVTLQGLDGSFRMTLLDCDSFVAATTEPEIFSGTTTALGGRCVTLGGYAVACLAQS
ncbi:MAG: D-apionate lactonase [Alphaproteobacteria bacterium]